MSATGRRNSIEHSREAWERDPDDRRTSDGTHGTPEPRERPPAAVPSRLAAVPWQKWVTTPAVLVLLLLALWLWISGLRLDSIERNSLNADAVREALLQHLGITLWATLWVLVIAVPLGILLTRGRFSAAAPVVTAIAGIGQAVPAIGLLALLTFPLGIGGRTAVVGLVIYAVLPVLSNTVTGLRGIDPGLLEAAKGIGMSPLGVLLKVELPLAVPLILGGIRTALVLTVGTATLAGFVSGGGLGTIITQGIVTQRNPTLIVGSVLAVALALLVDWIASIAEKLLAPRGLS